MGEPTSTSEERLADLRSLRDFLEGCDVWTCLTSATLLCALSDRVSLTEAGAPTLLIQPRSLPGLLHLANSAFSFELNLRPGSDLALSRSEIGQFWDGALTVSREGRPCAILEAFELFQDGVLRRVDIRPGVYWRPRDSFPHWFVEETTEVDLDGETFAAPREAERFLEMRFGADWATHDLEQLSAAREVPPPLHAAIAWCRARGWDNTRHAAQHLWPRALNGAGTTETVLDQGLRVPWWRDLYEVVRFY
ncbi:MAG: hypothetical protein JRI25_18615 [Deltaproteobacteria bacterium]|nr:hypothetical protein [Deltaproteobacteria bacterium]